MKVQKQKVIGILASLGLAAGVLSGCSGVAQQQYTEDDFDCKFDKKKNKMKCEADDGSGTYIYVPANQTQNGKIKPGTFSSSSFKISSGKVVSGSKGLGSSRAATGTSSGG